MLLRSNQFGVLDGDLHHCSSVWYHTPHYSFGFYQPVRFWNVSHSRDLFVPERMQNMICAPHTASFSGLTRFLHNGYTAAFWLHYQLHVLLTGFRTVVTYAEKSNKCSKHAKSRLRLVTKMLIEDFRSPKGDWKYDHAGILAMLASHGNVCNVQKVWGFSVGQWIYHFLVHSISLSLYLPLFNGLNAAQTTVCAVCSCFYVASVIQNKLDKSLAKISMYFHLKL